MPKYAQSAVRLLMVDEKIQRKRLYCNRCQHETNHALKGEHKGIFGDPELGEPEERLTYRLWICMGCERGLLEEEYWTGALPWADYEYFPKRSQHSLIAKPYSKLKPQLTAIYQEAITCYNEKALILCTAGLRALLEGICLDRKIKGNNLKAKIEGLKAILPNKNIIRNLHHFRFMGNDAVHELTAPKPTEVALAIGVIEDLLNFFYELDYKASQLREMRRAGKATYKTKGMKGISPPKPMPDEEISLAEFAEDPDAEKS
jgi:uncharacterized protein DUF4145